MYRFRIAASSGHIPRKSNEPLFSERSIIVKSVPEDTDPDNTVHFIPGQKFLQLSFKLRNILTQ